MNNINKVANEKYIDAEFEIIEKETSSINNHNFNIFAAIKTLEIEELIQLYKWLLFCDQENPKNAMKDYFEDFNEIEKDELIIKIIKQSVLLLNKSTWWRGERIYIDRNKRLKIKKVSLIKCEEDSISEENIKELFQKDIVEISNRVVDLVFSNKINNDRSEISYYKKCEVLYRLNSEIEKTLTKKQNKSIEDIHNELRDRATNIVNNLAKKTESSKARYITSVFDKVKDKVEEVSEETIGYTKGISERINLSEKTTKRWKQPFKNSIKKAVDTMVDAPIIQKTAKKVTPFVAGAALVEKAGIAPYLALSKMLGGVNILTKVLIGKGLPFATWIVGSQVLKCSLPALLPLSIYYYKSVKKDTILERIVSIGFAQLIVLAISANQRLIKQNMAEEMKKQETYIYNLEKSIENEKNENAKLKKEIQLTEEKLKQKELEAMQKLLDKYQESVKLYENLELEEHIIETINNAEESIIISVPWLSPYLFGKPKGNYPQKHKEFNKQSNVVKALGRASKRGVKVKIYTGFGDYNYKGKLNYKFIATVIIAKSLKDNNWYRKRFKNIDVQIIDSHDKVLVVDEKITYTGSFNFLSKSFQYSDKVEDSTERMLKLEIKNHAKERIKALEKENIRTEKILKKLPAALVCIKDNY